MGTSYKILKKKIKKLLELIFLINYYENKKYVERIETQVKEARSKGNGCIFITNVPGHGNLGDHAIYLAEKQFFEENYPDKCIVEIPTMNLKRNINKFKSIVEKEDCFFITGGGFIGSLWKWEQRSVNTVLLNFSDNPIVIFPQTVYFSPDKESMLIEFKKLIADCKKIEFCLRDKKSYKYVKENRMISEDRIHFMPDIVTYLKYEGDINERKDVLFCMRDDKERVSNSKLDEVCNYIVDKNISIDKTDTVVIEDLDYTKREKYVKNLLKVFAKHKLVVTDRLHGMIFAVITGTPCIAFDSLSKKVTGVYNAFLKEIDYVVCIGEGDTVELNIIDEFLEKENCSYGNEYLEGYYSSLTEICDKYLK